MTMPKPRLWSISRWVKLKDSDVEYATVDDQQFVVIAHEIVGGPRNSNARFQQAHLELAEAFLAAVVSIGNQRGH